MSLCIGCMHEIGNEVICPDCGFDNTRTQTAPYLPYGAVLNKRYVIGRNIETNGESALYIGYDRETSSVVLVREFLPAGYFNRPEGSVKLLIDPSKQDTFNRLMSDFEQFFGFLTTLRDMSAMNEITDIFHANNTCYVVEVYEEIISFEEYINRNNGHLEWEVARPLFMPVISLLEALHKNGYGHYAISPSNLYITTSGKALLLGFATINERRRGTPLKSQLFTGCAAPEQYENSFPIDNITDIYGFTATLFYALTGALPASAKERISDGALLMSTSTVKRLPPHVVSALANGLQVKREDRIIDFGDLRSQLSVAPTVKAIQEEISRTASMARTEKRKKKNFGMSPISVGIIVTVVASLIFLWIGIMIINNSIETTPPEQIPSNTVIPSQEATVSNEDWTGETLQNYVGKDFEKVRAELSAKGIMAYKDAYSGENDGYSDMFDAGVIMFQNFPEGTPLDVDNGFIVTFKVSRGPKAATLPNIENTSLASAVAKLTERGFVVYQDANVTHSDKIAEGKVIGYSKYDAGDMVSLDTPIYLIVSAGPEKTN